MSGTIGTSLVGPADARVGGSGDAASLKAKSQTVAVAAGHVINNWFVGPIVPRGALLLDVIVDSTDLDSNGTPLITLATGVAGTPAAYIAASTVPRTGGRMRADVVGALPAVMTADTEIRSTIIAAAATAAAGTVTITALFVPANG